jgi:hypothetical protein
MHSASFRRLLALAMTTISIGCGKSEADRANEPAIQASAKASGGISTNVPVAFPPATAREGSTIARAPQDDVLFVADEDHQALRVLPLPLRERFGTFAMGISAQATWCKPWRSLMVLWLDLLRGRNANARA